MLAIFGLLRLVRLAITRPVTRALLALIVPVVIGGTFFFRFVERMSWIDAFYFIIVTLTTVGFGDLVPQTRLGKLFTVFYIILGIGMVAAFFTDLAQAIIDSRIAELADETEERANDHTSSVS